MQILHWQNLRLRFPLILVASAVPLAFPLSQKGYAPLNQLALLAVLPAAVVVASAWLWLVTSGQSDVAALLRRGALAGALATFALELIRYPGFRLGFMPGNLPELMGVLLLDRLALGPSAASN